MFDNFDPNDPKTMGLLMAAASLIGGAPGGRKNLGADLSHGLLAGLGGYQTAQALKGRRAEDEQQQQMRAIQIQQARQAMNQQTEIQSLGQRAFAPPTQLDPRQAEAERRGLQRVDERRRHCHVQDHAPVAPGKPARPIGEDGQAHAEHDGTQGRG
jgi:hypothetical protein